MTSETLPRQRKMPPLNINAHKPRYGTVQTVLVTKTCTYLHRIEHRISRLRSRRAVIAGRLSPQIVITYRVNISIESTYRRYLRKQ